MRPCLVLVGLAVLGGLATAGCGLADVFRPAGLKDVVVRYTGPTELAVGDRVAPLVTVEAGGVAVIDPRLDFTSSDPTILALTPIGDTLVGCQTGRTLLTIRLIDSMVTDSTPTVQDSIRVKSGPSVPTCP